MQENNEKSHARPPQQIRSRQTPIDELQKSGLHHRLSSREQTVSSETRPTRRQLARCRSRPVHARSYEPNHGQDQQPHRRGEERTQQRPQIRACYSCCSMYSAISNFSTKPLTQTYCYAFEFSGAVYVAASTFLGGAKWPSGGGTPPLKTSGIYVFYVHRY